MAPRTSLACILTGPSRSAPDSDFIFLDGTLNQVLCCVHGERRPRRVESPWSFSLRGAFITASTPCSCVGVGDQHSGIVRLFEVV